MNWKIFLFQFRAVKFKNFVIQVSHRKIVHKFRFVVLLFKSRNSFLKPEARALVEPFKVCFGNADFSAFGEVDFLYFFGKNGCSAGLFAFIPFILTFFPARLTFFLAYADFFRERTVSAVCSAGEPFFFCKVKISGVKFLRAFFCAVVFY